VEFCGGEDEFLRGGYQRSVLEGDLSLELNRKDVSPLVMQS